ncbi:MAG TPA: hypothetical protein VFW40_10000 [Capsulimonadaceae bacterium]|nr:hypothetical protein [Capsulimonadaceae bacterium]
MSKKISSFRRFFGAAGLCVLLIASAGMVWAQSAPTKNVTVEFNRAPIRQALTQLFKGAGLNYALDPSVQGNVTASLHDVPFQVALETVLKANRPQLTYEVRDGVYQIHPRTLAQRRSTAASPARNNPTPTRSAQSTVRIPLTYANAALVAQYALGSGKGVPNGYGSQQQQQRQGSRYQNSNGRNGNNWRGRGYRGNGNGYRGYGYGYPGSRGTR